jgi:O-6-methylguanine DNA methyltransferase
MSAEMSDQASTLAEQELDVRPEPVRILIPSALGALGIELVGERLSRVVIVPRGRERKLFKPLSSLKPRERSDFLDEVLGRFSEFLAGARRGIDIEYDLSGKDLTPFAERVLKETAKIPHGKTRTYQQIAQGVGDPEAYRKVLSVLVVNPLPLVIPCHRVVTTKAGEGSYIAGAKKKAWLLKMEHKSALVV